MLAPQIKKKVDKLWNMFWSAGITNPLVAVEQITYLLFLKRLEALDNDRVKNGKSSIYEGNETCRWNFIKEDRTPQHLLDTVFPWLRTLEKKFAESNNPANGVEAIGSRMSDAYFQLDPNKGTILDEAIIMIDSLFERVDTLRGSTDIMGDTFEYLLAEIATAGKNGQFRTPRHIIRTMVELLDPKAGASVIDPAAGTGGFLFSTLNYILQKNTDPEQLRIEWDGTPHRVYGDQLTTEEFQNIHRGVHFVGFDNDRTMVRIGWMNMILHGIEDPQIHQRDSLGKRREDDSLYQLLVSENYDYVLANPPFTGTVDSADLDLTVFPKAGKSGKKASQAITNKSELLFVWRMLDLLRVGGRCAVIVPEGVLFGSTDAHAKLRRELLTEHLVEAVISLPGGVFQPYSGVKTSILVFQKETGKTESDKWKQTDTPRTQRVWFYELSEEVFSLDAKRNERRGQNNDLWDLIEKFKTRNSADYDELAFYQPQFKTERWRQVDKQTMEVFPEIHEVQRWQNQVAAIHELFSDLPPDPLEAAERAMREGESILEDYVEAFLGDAAKAIKEKATNIVDVDAKLEAAQKELKKAASAFKSNCNKQKILFDAEDSLGWPLYQKMVQATIDNVIDILSKQIAHDGTIVLDSKLIERNKIDVTDKIRGVAKEFAKLDGYDVMLRSLEMLKLAEPLAEPKSWFAPVRVYARNDEWQSEDGSIKGSHDEQGQVRPEYVGSFALYDDKGNLIDDLLDPDCIEARSWNLSAGQYKPFTFKTVKSDKSVSEMINELKAQEKKIVDGLDRLLAMVEGRA